MSEPRRPEAPPKTRLPLAPGGPDILSLGLERDRNNLARLDLRLLPRGADPDEATFLRASRLLNLFLQAHGGWRLHLEGPTELCERLAAEYAPGGARAQDADRMTRLYRRFFETQHHDPGQGPEARADTLPLGDAAQGCRLGFVLDEGAVHVAAVKEGEIVFSAQLPWNPCAEADPAYHARKLREGLVQAAAHLPRVDAIGGCLEGTLVLNEVRTSGLFSAVPEALFEAQAGPLFKVLEAEGGVPLRVLATPEVTALAEGRARGEQGILVLGGGSRSVGYLDREGRLTGWLNEPGPARLSLDSVDQLAKAADIPLAGSLSLPERVRRVQALAEGGDPAARSVFETLGDLLGGDLALYGEIYAVDHILIQSGLASGTGGALLLDRARAVLGAGSPAGPRLDLAGEASRVLQLCLAAASLPRLRPAAARPLAEPADPIARLVAALPELYQPIYGRPAIARQVSRTCEDRLPILSKVYQELAAHLGRPLRVLDLGCAQGFFSFHLAALGATVHGVDGREANIALCRALAEANPHLKTSFQASLVKDAIAPLAPGQFDLVLGLSVFHYDVHNFGPAVVQAQFAHLARAVHAGLFELALASEDTYWGPSLPEDPRTLLEGYACVQELARHPAWRPEILRPLFFASNHCTFQDGRVTTNGLPGQGQRRHT